MCDRHGLQHGNEAHTAQGDDYKHCCFGWEACNTACERVRNDINPDAREYLYGGYDEDDYRGGDTAGVAFRLAPQNEWAICSLHGQNQIYSWRPDSGAVKRMENPPILCYAIHDHHAFYYDRKAAAFGRSIKADGQSDGGGKRATVP